MQVQVIQATGPEKCFRLCAVEEIPAGKGRGFLLRGSPTRAVAVFRTAEGQVFAIDNACPHKGGPLAEGTVEAGCVACPMHGYRFDVQTGACDQANVRAVRRYETEVREGAVFICLP